MSHNWDNVTQMGDHHDYDSWVDQEFDVDDIVDDTYDPARVYEAESAYARVDKVFFKIGLVCKLHAVDGLQFREIATALRMKQSEVERCWKDGRAILKRHV